MVREERWKSGCIPMLWSVCLNEGPQRQKSLTPLCREAPFGRNSGATGFRRDFPYGRQRHGKHYDTKQVEVYAAREGEDWLVITVVAVLLGSMP